MRCHAKLTQHGERCAIGGEPESGLRKPLPKSWWGGRFPGLVQATSLFGQMWFITCARNLFEALGRRYFQSPIASQRHWKYPARGHG